MIGPATAPCQARHCIVIALTDKAWVITIALHIIMFCDYKIPYATRAYKCIFSLGSAQSHPTVMPPILVFEKIENIEAESTSINSMLNN